jgi:hypothetical protein
MNRHYPQRCAAAALLLALAAGASTATPVDAPVDAPVDIEALKRIYLACDRASSQRVLDMGEAATCSTASERLLQAGFAGDFDRLLAWWRGAKLAAAAPTDIARR